MLENLLELRGCFRWPMHGQVSLAPDISRIEPSNMVRPVDGRHALLIEKRGLQDANRFRWPAVIQLQQAAKHRDVAELHGRVFRKTFFEFVCNRLWPEIVPRERQGESRPILFVPA